jgi:hypothetical protein
MEKNDLIYLECPKGCATYADADEYYTHKIAENDLVCAAHSEKYQLALNLVED